MNKIIFLNFVELFLSIKSPPPLKKKCIKSNKGFEYTSFEEKNFLQLPQEVRCKVYLIGK